MNTAPAEKTKEPGSYIIPNDKVPHEVLTTIRTKVGSHNGRPQLDKDGNPIKVSIVTARENGSYLGAVVLNSDEWLAQAVGHKGTTVVIHKKDCIDFVSDKLKWLNNNKRMNTCDIQVHYDGDKAKAYPWDRNGHSKDATQSKDAAKPAPAREPSARDFMQAALEYLSQIKNVKSREAFQQHLGEVSRQVGLSKPAPAPEKTASKPAPAKGKAKEAPATEMER